MTIINARIEGISQPEISNGFLEFEGTKICRVGPMEEYDGTGECFDAKGMRALPGLIDAHSHIGLFGDGLGFEGDDGNEATDPVTPQLCAADGINPMDRCFSEALDYGVTTVVTGPGSANPISGCSAALKTAGCCVDDMLVAPVLAMKMALGENPKGTYAHRSQTPTTRMATAAVIREALSRAKRYLEDFERSREDGEDELEPPEYDAKCEALIPVLKGELAVHIHAHRADDIFTAARLAREFSLRCVLVHATESHLVAERLARCGLPVICGPMLGSRSKPELVAASRQTPAVLERFGIPVAICTDHPELPQECLMLSAAIAHREGLSRAAALRAVTLTPAEICGLSHRIGSLEPGKDADILLYDADPLGGLEKPAAVFLDGVQVR